MVDAAMQTSSREGRAVYGMRFDPEKHHRRSVRLPGYDYSQAGAYFVTLCARGRERLFGAVVGSEVRLNGYGQAVPRCWEWLPRQYPKVDIDEWVVMPNHLHGTIIINNSGGGSRTARSEDIERIFGGLRPSMQRGTGSASPRRRATNDKSGGWRERQQAANHRRGARPCAPTSLGAKGARRPAPS